MRKRLHRPIRQDDTAKRSGDDNYWNDNNYWNDDPWEMRQEKNPEIQHEQKPLTEKDESTENIKTNQEDTEYCLNNGETVYGNYSDEIINGFNNLYDSILCKELITTDVWSFQSYLNGESVVGNYLAHYIQELPGVPEGYNSPATFALSGVQPTYDAARLYANCWGNCYTTTASRVNKAYEDLFGFTPIDYTQNENGTFTSMDYRISSSQGGVPNFGYGVGGALAYGGEGVLVDNAGVWSGELRPGAALQIWHSTDEENLTQFGGHSQIFLNYTYDEDGIIDGIDVYDNSGTIEHRSRETNEGFENIRGANLLDTP